VLSPVTGLSCHRRRRNFFRQLEPASGRHDHTILPSAISAARFIGTAASTASRPTSVTIAKRPFEERDATMSGFDLPDGTSALFFCQGVDPFLREATDLPVGQITRGCDGLDAGGILLIALPSARGVPKKEMLTYAEVVTLA
jgi:hypothetical protein